MTRSINRRSLRGTRHANQSPASIGPALLWPAPARPVAVGDDLARVRRRQHRLDARLSRGWRRPLVRRSAILGLPLSLMVVALLVAGPALYQGARAYQDVFVEPVPHRPYPLLPGVGGTRASPGPVSTPVVRAAEADTPPAAAPVWDGREPLTMLLLGIDRRGDEPARTDTMILVRIDPIAKEAALLSIPRDLKVVVPGYGLQKINAAFAFGETDDLPGGGPALAIRTIEANFGIRIDHFAQVDFAGFVELVDLAGGVTIDVPYPFVDEAYPTADYGYTHVEFAAGPQHLDGERALQYARTRHADGDGARSARQQQIILALREQASLEVLLPRAGAVLSVLGDSVRTDLSPERALGLLRLAAEIPSDRIATYALMDTVTIEDPNGVYYLVADWEAVGRVLSDFTRTAVVPPAIVLSQVDYGVPIRVVNGTMNDGLAVRVGELLIAHGFTNVLYEAVADPGAYLETTLTDRSGSLATVGLVAAIAGLDPAIADLRAPDSSLDPASPAVTPSDAGASGIVLILGDDAPDPAWYAESAA